MQMVTQFKNVRSWELRFAQKDCQREKFSINLDERGADEGRHVLVFTPVLLDLDELSPQANCVR